MSEVLDVTWIHGAPDCDASTDPPLQVHQYDPDTWILRQGKCSDPGVSFEAPFMYLLVGSARALLLDTGATQAPARVPVAATVLRLLEEHADSRGRARVPLLVAHSHSHGDHLAGDGQFQGLADTTVVQAGVTAVKAVFGLPGWPDGQASLNLGGRLLDVVPAPGHEQSHLVIYDRATGLLLTGDTLYPGLLVVNDAAAYAATAARLAAFVADREVSHILGAHVEMTSQPGHWFGLGATHQPGEHVLQLQVRHLEEWAEAVAAMGTELRVDRHDDFILFTAGGPLPSLAP